MYRRYNLNEGFSLIGAIVVMLILSLMGAYLLHVRHLQIIHFEASLLERRVNNVAISGLVFAKEKFTLHKEVCPNVISFYQGIKLQITCSSSYNGSFKNGNMHEVELVAKASWKTFGEPGYISKTLTSYIEL